MWRKGSPTVLFWGMQTSVTNLENSMKFPRKIKMELPFDPVIQILGIHVYLKNPRTLIQKNMCTPVFIAALFRIAKIWKQPKCPSVDEWVKKL